MDRPTLSAAIDVVSRLVGLYPNGGQSAGDGYIGGLAKVLMGYPRSVAGRAADPINGVARDTKFLPTPADVVAWCERETAPLHENWIHAKRAADQIEQRDDGPTPAAIVDAAKAWLKRDDWRAQKLTGVSTEAEMVKAEKALASNRDALERRNAETVAEYEAADLTPLSIGRIPISIELARMLGKEPTDYRSDAKRSA